MVDSTPKVKTRTVVNRSEGVFTIQTLSDFGTYGATSVVPDISAAEIADGNTVVDGVGGREGELILSMGSGSDAWLDGRGQLIIQPDASKDDADRYSVDASEGELQYQDESLPAEADNVLAAPGDVLNIRVRALVLGRLVMNTFNDVITNEEEGRTVQREFRVSVDGMFYTEWLPLTVDNLSANIYRSDSLLSVEVRYTRTGIDDGVALSFQSLTIGGAWTSVEFIAPTLMASVLGSLIGTDVLKEIEENLFKKLYFRGVIPKYIVRAENVDYQEDRDYIALFRTVAEFFGLLITFFKRFENARNDAELLREMVRGMGIFFDEGSATVEELRTLAAGYYNQIQQRGTDMIAVRKGETLPSGAVASVDGELIRLLHSAVYNELIIGAVALHKMGWCVGASSPLYRGTSGAVTLNKTPKNTADFQTLDHFLITEQGGATVAIQEDSEGDKRVMEIAFSAEGVGGIGRLSGSGVDAGPFLVVADPGISYEVTFAFRIVSDNPDGIDIAFGVEGFNDNGQRLNDAFITVDGAVNDGEFWNQNAAIWRTGVWYFARGIIHAYNTDPVEGTHTNLGVGTDLVFNNSFLRYICPRILVSGAEGEVQLWDYKIRPLVWGKSILPDRNGGRAESNSLGFVQTANFMYTYARNNNNSKSQEEITDIIEKYLYPYGKINMFVFTGNK